MRDYEALELIIDEQIYPPWDDSARCRNIVLKSAVYVDAWVGSSGVEWCGPGYGRSGHPPSTLDSAGYGQVSLSEAAERELAWLELQSKGYFTEAR